MQKFIRLRLILELGEGDWRQYPRINVILFLLSSLFRTLLLLGFGDGISLLNSFPLHQG